MILKAARGWAGSLNNILVDMVLEFGVNGYQNIYLNIYSFESRPNPLQSLLLTGYVKKKSLIALT